MSEYPIIFSSPMVRAILEGRKSVTRRLSKQWLKRKLGDKLWVRETWQDYCPIWAGCWCDHETDDGIRKDHKAVYRADAVSDQVIYDTEEQAARWGRDVVKTAIGPPDKWLSSMFMPRWASRIMLEVTEDARLERLRDITEEEASAEGFHAEYSEPYWTGFIRGRDGLEIKALEREVVPIHGRGWGERPAPGGKRQMQIPGMLCWSCDKL